MLEYMRRHSQSYLIYLFFGIIIVVFVFFFGPQSRGCGPPRSTVVASVGEEEISSRQLEQLFMRTSNWETRIPAEQRVDPSLRRRLLAEDLVLVQLLAAYAREAGLAVSDEQLSAYVRDPQRNADYNEYRDRDGNFSMEQFELRVPGAFGLALPQYEAWKEAELLATGYIDLLGAAIPITHSEVEAVYKLRNTRYQLEFIRFDPTELAELFAVTDDQVATLLDQEPDRVREYYEANLDSFRQERQLRVRRILIPLGQEDDPEGQAEARQRFETALARIQENPDSFPEVAQEFSQATEAAQGGDMGLKTEAEYDVYPFLQGRLAEIPVGSIQTHESSRSLVIFRIEEDIEASTPDFEEIATTAARALLESEQPEEPARLLAEEFLSRAQEGLTLQEIAEEYNETHASGPQQPPSDQPQGDEPPSAQAPADAQGGSRPLLQASETELFALDTPGFDFSLLGPEYANQPRMPGDPENIPGLGRLPRLARHLVQLSAGNPVAPEVYSDGQAFYVARLIQYEVPSETIEPEVFDEIRDEIWRDKLRALFGDWESRLLLHQARPLSPFLSEVLDLAMEQGLVKFNEGYFGSYVAEQPTS